MDLFDHAAEKDTSGVPLADRMRPHALDDLVGQPQLLAPGSVLRRAIENDRIPSMIIWGPPGCGKTSLARVLSSLTRAEFVAFSAVLSGVPELRKLIAAAVERKRMRGLRTLLFVDEIHRFNRSQQDALLPHVEQGNVTLIGATTENPSFAVNAALLSRARVFQLHSLEEEALATLLGRALQDGERGLGALGVTAEQDSLRKLARLADGDARRALDALELAAHHVARGESKQLDDAAIEGALSERTLLHDKQGEAHYNVSSAFIKSLRGSDPDAAIYYMMRLLEAGDDPLFVSRRMLIFAGEDIGTADPMALQVAVAADTALQRLGMPEGTHALSQACHYLACAPKSNACYRSWKQAREDVRQRGALPVPMKLRNAATRSMKDWGYGAGYRYPHDHGGYLRGETYLPEDLDGTRYFEPTLHGYEEKLHKRLARLRGEPGSGESHDGPQDDEREKNRSKD